MLCSTSKKGVQSWQPQSLRRSKRLCNGKMILISQHAVLTCAARAYILSMCCWSFYVQEVDRICNFSRSLHCLIQFFASFWLWHITKMVDVRLFAGGRSLKIWLRTRFSKSHCYSPRVLSVTTPFVKLPSYCTCQSNTATLRVCFAWLDLQQHLISDYCVSLSHYEGSEHIVLVYGLLKKHNQPAEALS